MTSLPSGRPLHPNQAIDEPSPLPIGCIAKSYIPALSIAEQTPFEFAIFADVSRLGASRDSRDHVNFDWDWYIIGLRIFCHGVFRAFNFDNRSQSKNTMHVAESQRVFLGIVQDALHRYDTQLKDINHKVRDPFL